MFFDTEERELMRNIAREFAEQEVKPAIAEMEKNVPMPRELFRRMGELGFAGLGYSEEQGGLGKDLVTLGIVVEEIAKVSPAVAFTWLTSNSSCSDVLAGSATPKQVEEWLKPNIAGEMNFAISSNEPCGGSNFPEFQTKAVLDGDEWVINGTKNMTTNRESADLFLTVCITSPVDMATMRGVSLIAIPADAPGVTLAPSEEKVGMHGCQTGGVTFTNVRVPKENVIGPVDEYLTSVAGVQLQTSFALYGAMFLGGAEACYQKALDFAKMKAQFGATLFDSFQIVQEHLGDIKIDIDMWRAYTYSCLDMITKGENAFTQAMGLKIRGPRFLEAVARESMITLGSSGVVVDAEIERYLRDALTLEIGGGSTHALYATLATGL